MRWITGFLARESTSLCGGSLERWLVEGTSWEIHWVTSMNYRSG